MHILPPFAEELVLYMRWLASENNRATGGKWPTIDLIKWLQDRGYIDQPSHNDVPYVPATPPTADALTRPDQAHVDPPPFAGDFEDAEPDVPEPPVCDVEDAKPDATDPASGSIGSGGGGTTAFATPDGTVNVNMTVPGAANVNIQVHHVN
jgi:hypothetical protein